MKITVVNGSPRKGNTLTAIDALIEGASANHEIEVIHADKLNISGCKGCGSCECYKGCIATDDTNPTIDKIVNADAIIFTSPVYWWGVSAQLKLVIDKCYCRGALIKGKKVGVIIVGGAGTDDDQYRLIQDQFKFMAQYLSWDLLFYKPFSATAKDDLSQNTQALEELKALGASIA